MLGTESDEYSQNRNLVLILNDKNLRMVDLEYSLLVSESIEESNDCFVRFWENYAESEADYNLIHEVWAEHLKDYYK